MTKQTLGIKASKSMLIDAISPIGSVPLLVTALEDVLKEYFEHSDSDSITESRIRCLVIKEFPGESISKGQVYKLTISLQEVYGFREKTMLKE